MAEEGDPVAAVEQDLIVRQGHLPPELMSSHSRPFRGSHPVETQAVPYEAVVAQILVQGQRVLTFRDAVEMPAVELPQLLTKPAHVEAHVPREARPVGVGLFDVEVPTLERGED